MDTVKYLVEKAHCDIGEYYVHHHHSLILPLLRVKYSNHTHSCSDVIDDNGDTPLDIATRNSLSTDYDEYEREIYSEIVDYLKSLPTKHSE